MHISRDELYRLISERPLSKVAPELGISATALARVCRTHNVPYPGSGYWTKKAMGLPVELVPLPTTKEGAVRIELKPTTASTGARRSLPRSSSSAPTESPATPPAPTVQVSDRLTRPHPLIARWLMEHEERTRKASRSRDPWQVRLAPAPWTTLDRRRHRILDAVFKAVEARGGEIGEGPKGLISATISGEQINFQVREKLRQIKIPQDDKRRSYMTTELIGTGNLVFAIRTYLRGSFNEEWRETERRPLETQVPEIVDRLFEGAKILRAWREERDAEAERWRLESEKRAEIERIRLLDEARKAELIKLAERWETAQRLKTYLGALAATQPSLGEVAGDRSVGEWFEWAEAFVAELDKHTGTAPSAFSAVSSATPGQ
ncbi:hypothetical protein ACFSX5_10685 [Devosia albogilva]|uniref:Uncharacterized protein n=1 Tax=Devosia albogilva TaxID=429726 RepID=A0ABW5QKI2_9HYPH